MIPLAFEGSIKGESPPPPSGFENPTIKPWILGYPELAAMDLFMFAWLFRLVTLPETTYNISKAHFSKDDFILPQVRYATFPEG